jgi:hypothetical protein
MNYHNPFSEVVAVYRYMFKDFNVIWQLFKMLVWTAQVIEVRMVLKNGEGSVEHIIHYAIMCCGNPLITWNYKYLNVTGITSKILRILKDFSLHQTDHSILRLNTSRVCSVRSSPGNSRIGHQYWEFIEVCQKYFGWRNWGKETTWKIHV